MKKTILLIILITAATISCKKAYFEKEVNSNSIIFKGEYKITFFKDDNGFLIKDKNTMEEFKTISNMIDKENKTMKSIINGDEE